MRYIASVILLSIAAMAFCGCRHIDDERIPPVPVYIPFATQAEWEIYGVNGACTWKAFIKSERIPSDYPWTVMCETGFGGVLLCGDIHGNPVAYDLACPVEVKQNVRVVVEDDIQRARCPVCGSVYDVYTNYGAPYSGRAAELGYGLSVLRVDPGTNGRYRVITL